MYFFLKRESTRGRIHRSKGIPKGMYQRLEAIVGGFVGGIYRSVPKA
jgi:hypothetical protein